MRTMKTIKVYEWLMNNQMHLAAPALASQFGLAGEAEHEAILQFLGTRFKNPDYIFRQIKCAVTTTLYF